MAGQTRNGAVGLRGLDEDGFAFPVLPSLVGDDKHRAQPRPPEGHAMGLRLNFWCYMCPLLFLVCEGIGGFCIFSSLKAVLFSMTTKENSLHLEAA